MNTQKEHVQDTGNDGAGRTHNSSGSETQPAQQNTSADISGIDQQEGNMNNGEVGDADKENVATSERKN